MMHTFVTTNSFIQRGIPVATVAINNSTNAALLAVRILSAGIPWLIDEMQTYMNRMEKEVMVKAARLEEVGWKEYVPGPTIYI